MVVGKGVNNSTYGEQCTYTATSNVDISVRHIASLPRLSSSAHESLVERSRKHINRPLHHSNMLSKAPGVGATPTASPLLVSLLTKHAKSSM